MANELKVAKVLSIKTLHAQGWSQRRIARELGVNRSTVARHLKSGPERSPDPSGAEVSERAKAPTRSETAEEVLKPAKAPTGSGSLCAPFRAKIEAKIEQGLTAQRIFQDLVIEHGVIEHGVIEHGVIEHGVIEHGFGGKYHNVRPFVGKLKGTTPLPFRRREVAPGEEAQIDLGTGVPIVNDDVNDDGSRRRTHVLRVVLSHSRKAYSEAVYRQTTDSLIHCLENAFWHFGGVPKTLVRRQPPSGRFEGRLERITRIS